MRCIIKTKKFLHTIFLGAIILLVSCVKGSETPDIGTVSISAPSGPSEKPLVFLRITNSLSAQPHPGATLNPGNSIQLKAILIGDGGLEVQPIEVSWSVSGALRASDLSTNDGSATDSRATFSASAIATGNIVATVVDLNLPIFDTYNISSTSSLSGLINVNHSIVQDSVSVISGNTQTAQAGALLSSPLTVRVVNVGGVAVPGVNVTFESGLGNNGSQLLCGAGSGIVVTDLAGIASCQVKLGGSLGATNQVFYGKISSGSGALAATFNHTATPGAPYKLTFTQEPVSASKGTSMVATPVRVAIQDQFGNTVPSASDTVTLSKFAGNGTGVLGGLLSLPANNGGTPGEVKFTTLSYSAAELGVKIRATATGLLPVTSSAFDVSDVIIEAACSSHILNWSTAEGGCKDGSSGLVWSAPSHTSPAKSNSFSADGLIAWDSVIWDDAFASKPRTQLEIDLNILNDYAQPVHMTDSNSLAYCHDLNESGYDDWRTPSREEFESAAANGAGSTLKNVSNLWYHTANPYNGGQVWSSRLDAVSSHANWSRNQTTYVRCVRVSPATKLIFQSGGPSFITNGGFGQNAPFENPPVVRVAESGGIVVKRSGVVVKLTAHKVSDNSVVPLWIDNTTASFITKTTDATGSVAFTGVGSTIAGAIYLKAVGNNVAGPATDYTLLTPAISNNLTIQTNFPWAQCKQADGTWINAQGGCKDKARGLIYSSFTTSTRTWHDSVWDEISSGGSAADVDDFGRNNDYDLAYMTAGQDGTPKAYCKDLTESGQTDWRMPTYEELYEMSSRTPLTNLNITQSNSFFWSSAHTTWSSGVSGAIRFSDRNFEWGYNKNSGLYNVCVRRDPPSQMSVLLSSSAQTPSYAIGTPFNLTVNLKDSDGSPTKANGSVTISLPNTATGSIFEGTSNRGTFVTKPITNGTVTFSIAYNRNETFRFDVTATTSWKGANIPITSAQTALVDFDPLVEAECISGAPAGWSNDVRGGCRNATTGLTWSHLVGHDTSWPDQGIRTGFCTSLPLGGYNDWRVPTATEWTDAFTPAISVDGALKDFSVKATYGVQDANSAIAAYSASKSVGTFYGSFMGVRCVR